MSFSILFTKYSFIIAFLLMAISCSDMKEKKYQTDFSTFDDYPFSEEILWLDYTSERTIFKLWSPTAEQVRIHFYMTGQSSEKLSSENLERGDNGVWSLKISENLEGKYYAFEVMINGLWLNETPGIYAQAVGVNGNRAMVLDLSKTNPTNWETDKRPSIKKPNEAIIYELHVRDLTSNKNSGSSYSGKYLGIVESGTKFGNFTTGIDHLKELGITYVHLLPAYDHYSIDETKLDSPQFNWGYDPQNYNVPEGSFATNPFDAAVRIKEFKTMVQEFHNNGIGVILDVVYNHTGKTQESNFNQEVPDYYYRQNQDGTWSNASGCGNETASDRAMMRKFMKESILYWAQEYHIDAFRFDLMGIHDLATMNEIAAELKQVNSSIFIYGEGWTAGSSPLADEQKALKKNTHKMPNISAFSDDLRDGLKGSVFDDKSTGFVSGAFDMEESIKFGVVGSIDHPQINYKKVNYSNEPWAKEPWQAISYVSCHDNHTLFDKLMISRPDASEDDITAMHLLANGIVLTSQGVSFLHAGVELMRTKDGEHNSYNKTDAINGIDWNWKKQNQSVFEYHKKLIELRKAHPAFYMPNADMVRENLSFESISPGTISFVIDQNANGDSWKKILVCYNATTEFAKVDLQENWWLAAIGKEINETGIGLIKNEVRIPPISMLIAFQK